ncbi:hypothetical protein V6N11_016822 [Hibiscus sabdariffa]|uniref:BHLH domain-containing protein n=1 Tax=Hibiscus sabdariffa TaxID=183260 RepID=A0ABR2TWI7_9ROSI
MGVKPSDESLPSIKTQKQDPVAPCNNTVLMNFSHFSRPAAVVKASLQNIGAKATIEENGIVPMKTDIKESKAKSQDTPVGTEPNGATGEENVLENDKISNQVIDENASKCLPHNDMDVESVLAASSVCCGNNVERASDDPVVHNLRRKNRDDEEFECPSEDTEEEYIGVKKAIHARGGKGSKRSRAAEVHNLSERRRRDRINEKMRALQELIPNCNKVDKASMLDEAIEYLKTLQLQVQHMHAAAAAHMTHVSPMSVGMGVGMGFGMRFPQMYTAASACPMVQVSPIPGPPFSGPGPHLSGATTLHEMTGSNLHLYGLHGQELLMSMPGAPLIPIPGEHLMKSALGLNGSGLVGPMDNKDSATASSSKDPIQNINSQVTENTNINSSVNQTSTRCRTTNESFEQPAEMQENSRASEITSSVPFKSTDGDDKFPDRS